MGNKKNTPAFRMLSHLTCMAPSKQTMVPYFQLVWFTWPGLKAFNLTLV